jgi:hypothetical protein
VDVFGTNVAIDGDNAIVSARLSNDEAGGYMFTRDHGGPDAWGQAAALSLGLEARCTESAGPAPGVSISRDTAVLFCGAGFFADPSIRNVIRIFERNGGGANAWGEVAVLHPTNLLVTIAISGKLMLVGVSTLGSNPHTFVYSRHQGDRNGWGEVARFHTPNGAGETSNPFARAISGDTVFVGSLAPLSAPGSRPTPTEVYVADTDRDGLRDGVDPCPRDPLNRTDKHCRRDTSSLPTVDHLITSSDFTTTFVGPRRAVVTATFTNTSSVAILNPFFAVTEITEGAVLLNGDGLDRGVGATLSPDVGDGILSPGESTFVRFRVRLPHRGPLRFGVAVHGEETP